MTHKIYKTTAGGEFHVSDHDVVRGRGASILEEPYKIRPSLKPLAHICPSAVEPTEYKVDRPSKERDLGQATHYLLARTAEGMDMTITEIVSAGTRYRVDQFQLADNFFNGLEAWRTLKPYFPDPLVEVPLYTGGTADVLQIDLDKEIAAVVLDWKKRKSQDTRPQVLDYAHGAREHMRNLGMKVEGRKFKAVAVYTEGGGYDVWTFTDEDFAQREEREERIRAEAGKVFAPGEHCGICPRFHTCGPREAQGASGLRLLQSAQLLEPEHDTGLMTREKAVEMWKSTQVIYQALGEFKGWLKAVLEESGTTLPLGNGKEVYIQTQKVSDIDPSLAWPVLIREGLTSLEMKEVLSVGLDKAKKIIRSKHGKDIDGILKKEAEYNFMQRLSVADAVSISERTKLATRNEPDE